jgi:lambda family phage minor tail protein L
MSQADGGTVDKDIREIARGSLVRFYDINLRSAGVNDILHFHPGLNEFGGPVKWRGVEYLPFPIAIEGMEYDGQGRLPRPTLTVTNLRGPLQLDGGAHGRPDLAEAAWGGSGASGAAASTPDGKGERTYGNLGALVRALGDLNGCTVAHRMTLARFIDAENFRDGNDEADPTLEFPKDIYIFERKAEETPEYIKFELATALDLEGQMLPKRTYNANYCPHRYRGPLCNYTGARLFDEGDAEVSDPGKDRCGKRLRSCELRRQYAIEVRHKDGSVQSSVVHDPLPFGGFPGVGLVARS